LESRDLTQLTDGEFHLSQRVDEDEALRVSEALAHACVELVEIVAYLRHERNYGRSRAHVPTVSG
jgi:hypothetical protein